MATPVVILLLCGCEWGIFVGTLRFAHATLAKFAGKRQVTLTWWNQFDSGTRGMMIILKYVLAPVATRGEVIKRIAKLYADGAGPGGQNILAI